MVEATGGSILLIGALASLGAGLATGVGALPVFAVRELPAGLDDALLGFAAGVMLAATSFSLLLPAITYGGGGLPGALAAVVGLGGGAVFLDLVDRASPHRHFQAGPEGGPARRLAAVWLFVVAITIHNFPEGLAVGVGFAGGDVGAGMVLAIAIGLQNLPEGLAVAVALVREGYGAARAFLVASLTGLVEPVGGVLGLGALQLAAPLLPYALAFAAGAMLFVISDEIIPETHRAGAQRVATYALMVGFGLMLLLDGALG
jgi:ZIP family zinc transporter